MNKTRDFLTELDDYELAFFAKFKTHTYLPETQAEIKKYLAEKQFTETKIEQLISVNPKKEALNGKIRCPRCSSDKIRTEKVEWTNTAGQIGYSDEIATMDGISGKATYRNQMICNVCEFWVKDPNGEKRKKTFWQYVGNLIFDIFTTP